MQMILLTLLKGSFEQGALYSTYYEDILYIYPPEMYVSEAESVHYTKDFLLEAHPISLDIPSFIEKFEADNHITFGDAQKRLFSYPSLKSFLLLLVALVRAKQRLLRL